MPTFAKKIIFNITQTDLDRLTGARTKLGLQQSEYIRRAIRMYVAEQKIEELDQVEVNHYARPRAHHGVR